LVEGSLWVFHNKVHYLILLLVCLVTYYTYREKGLQRPEVSRNTPRVDDYERQKEENTQREVNKLKNSREYQEYERRKRQGLLKKDEGEDDGEDWEKAEQEIFDD
jgi:hypothetical protein